MRRILSAPMKFIGVFLLNLCSIAAFATAPTSPGHYILPYTHNGTTYTKALQIITLSNDSYGAEKAATYFYNGTAKFHGGYSVFKFFSSPKVLLVNSVDDIYGNGNDYVYEYTQSQDPDDPYWFGLANPICFDDAYLKSSVDVYQETDFDYQSSNYHCNFNFDAGGQKILSKSEYFFVSMRYPVDYTIASPNGWGAEKQSYGSLNNTNGVPHVAEDWNKGSGSDDLGEALYAISNGKIEDINDGSSSDGWGKTVLIRHDAPAGKYFLTGTGELLTTVYAMYAHLLKSGQTGYNSVLDLVGTENSPVLKGAAVGQVGTGDGQYVSHLHFEIRKNDPNSYLTTPYSWAEISNRVDPSELINNGWYSAESTSFSLVVHPYECTGTFKLNSTTPTCNGSSSTIGDWSRQGANFNPGSPQLGYSGIIFSKETNSSGTANWSPALPKNGQYRVWVYVPANTTYASSTSTTYTVSSNGTTYTSQTVNQYTAAQGSNRWVDIGTYNLYATGNSTVSLQGNTGETAKSITVDAVKFEYMGAIP